jgi:hypothetical protein
VNGISDRTPLSQNKYLAGLTIPSIDLVVDKRCNPRSFVGYVCKLLDLYLSCSLRHDCGQPPRITILIVFDERIGDRDDTGRATIALKKLMIGRALMRIYERADTGRMRVLEAVQ